MAWSQSDVATLEKAIATGAKSVRFSDGRMVEYNSLKDLLTALDLVKASLAGVDVPRVSFAKFTRN